MLKVYIADWCAHCNKTVEYLERNAIPFEPVYIEGLPEDEVQKLIEVNGGDEWAIPTLQFNGIWHPAKIFNEQELEQDLKELGVI